MAKALDPKVLEIPGPAAGRRDGGKRPPASPRKRGMIAIALALGLGLSIVPACAPTEAEFAAEKDGEAREFMERVRGGPGMMRPGSMGSGTVMGPGFGMMGGGLRGDANLSREQVEAYFANHLAMHGDGRLKVGEVRTTKERTFIVDIVTVEGAPVTSYEVDRHTGLMRPVR